MKLHHAEAVAAAQRILPRHVTNEELTEAIEIIDDAIDRADARLSESCKRLTDALSEYRVACQAALVCPKCEPCARCAEAINTAVEGPR